MDVAGVHRSTIAGVENHRLLMSAVSKICNGVTDRVLLNFTTAAEARRLEDVEFLQFEQTVAWSSRRRCLDDPGCAEVLLRGR